MNLTIIGFGVGFVFGLFLGFSLGYLYVEERSLRGEGGK